MELETERNVRGTCTLDVVPQLPRLHELRLQRALSQRELARAAGVNPDTIRRLEAHAASAQFPTIRKLAAALRVEPIDLMGREEND